MGTCQVTILVTSDVHGHVLPLNYGTNQPEASGLAKIATLIKREKALNENLLIVDNGDSIQGTPLTYHYAKFQPHEPNPMMQIFNHLGYDAAIIGNHEFNYGLGLLEQAVRESRFPWLSANIVDSKTGEPHFGTPYIIKTFANGLRVGLLGLTTPYIPNWEKPDHIRGLRFDDAVACAKHWVKRLRKEEGVDLVVVSYHGGFERDLDTGEPVEALTGENQGYELCMEVDGIDVLLTGHQHQKIAGKTVNGVAVIQPGSFGACLGKVTVTLEKTPEGFRVQSKTSELLCVDDVEADADVVRLIAPYEEQTQRWLDQPIGRIEGDMRIDDPLAVRLKDHPLIEFINRVQMEAAGVDISNTALFDNQSPGFPPDVTMRSVVANYVYPNTLVVLRVTGRDIKAALERSATYFEIDEDGGVRVSDEFTAPKPQHYNYDMWEGIEYVLDIRRPKGDRVTKLNYKGKPVDPDGEYDVVMNNYRAAGGGNYHMYKGKPVVKDIPIDMSELIANYILKHKVIKAEADGNWQVVY